MWNVKEIPKEILKAKGGKSPVRMRKLCMSGCKNQIERGSEGETGGQASGQKEQNRRFEEIRTRNN